MKRFLLALTMSIALMSAGVADAGRLRPLPPTAQDVPTNRTPTTPEPSAAIAFALGIGLVGWATRRNRR